MSSQPGWSCDTIQSGFCAVIDEEDAALLQQEEEILKQIKDRCSLIVVRHNQLQSI